MRRHLPLLVLVSLLVALCLPLAAQAHPERTTAFPYPAKGHVPKYRTAGPSLVVCKPVSKKLLRRMYRHDHKTLVRRMRTYKRCRFGNIQTAINHAKSGYRILIMPGVYRETPSRRVSFGAPGKPPCAKNYVTVEGDYRFAPPPAGPASNDPPDRADRNYAIHCPNSKNLIAVIGDTRPEKNPSAPSLPKCIRLCNLQIEGLGKRPEDVLIQGDRMKNDVVRIDRANGIFLRNFAVEQASFNDVDIVEVDGFRASHLVTRWAENYGILSFTTIHGLYDHDTAYGNGDSGLYPGSTQKGCDVNPNAYGTCQGKHTCGKPSIEIRDSNSYGNTLGYSGTAGNSTYVHNNRFHDNATGLTTDSFASGHPGMPQECFNWQHNDINSNNFNPFTAERQSYCSKVPFEKRPVKLVCPQFQTAVGTGVLIGGGSKNTLKANHLYDNWREGVLLLSVPAPVRGDNDPGHYSDTSNENQFVDNVMGQAPNGAKKPNGLEFKWDSTGNKNCFQGNKMQSGKGSIPPVLPSCPNSIPNAVPFPTPVDDEQLPCTAWDPKAQPRPPGCDWFDTPAKP
jgi:hypothetical protein